MDFQKLTIHQANKLLIEKKISVKELVDFFYNNANQKNSQYNTYLGFYDDVQSQINKAQKMIDDGVATKITGIPIAIKDNILIDGKIASAGSKILENYKATFDSTVIKKLKDAGAIFLGRTNMDEFAMGGSTENSAYGPTKNAFDINRVAGGSSGGSAVAVATSCAIASLGSDTGGSIRLPASFNGVVGLKPTYGAVSRHGLMAMGSSLDVIGPFTKDVSDSELIFDLIKGKDKYDSTSSDGQKEKEILQNKNIKKIGVPFSYLKDGIDSDVLENFNKSIEKFKANGYEIVDIKLPNLKYSLAVYYTLMPAEVSSNMARYDGVKFGSKISGEKLIDDYLKTRGNLLGKEVRRRIILGTYVLSAGYADEYYNKAWQVRNMIKGDFVNAFKEVDVILMPTSPTPAFKIGEKINDPLTMYLADIFTVFVNLVGVPAISIPDGFVKRDDKNLPTSIQLIAPHFCEQVLFEIGKKFETIQ
ncbi:MAG TPA: Asp-tRNA(Asn)/Glu-tRNA(Gln) amidotransferase subunit GatA [Candidatus Paceibacterota bacterium]|nr:Asp-tRNA(Asn)/Glu-tRNA(Gln) amidotransferase subunit GatA [Candidatus Paceibacterota bacterium]HMP19155.1 Asp-tRNA(Asn)/Glu-tRNA(Gln) amidotransferase subunit GatA [Candidatus Paceibacterota bacterium]HMP85206.1 Asp-tRNA(Asn)/Glu-tRNA(Gln) amidotransferase subunit GatA [Candidatus Paceibacterota bacterium]